jgi:hypothetical protein
MTTDQQAIEPQSQPVNEGGQVPAGPPPVPAPYGVAPPKSNRNMIIAVVAVVVVIAIVLAAILLMTGQGAGAPVKNGDFLNYDMSAEYMGMSIDGTFKMEFRNVTSSSCNMILTFTMMGTTQTQDTKVDLSGKSWSEFMSKSLDDANSIELVGTEQLSTAFGQKTVNHYEDSSTGLNMWMDASTSCLYKLTMSTQGVDMTCELTDTNIGSFGL